MPNIEPRKAQLNADIEEKLFFLAKLAARQKGQSLVEFIEDAFAQALSPEAMKGMRKAEPNVAEPTGPIQPIQRPSLWMEDLWVDTGKPEQDFAARLYKAGTKDVNLLAPKQRTLFYYIVTELLKQGKKVTLKNFVGFIELSESGK
jgi:hypothetical protein